MRRVMRTGGGPCGVTSALYSLYFFLSSLLGLYTLMGQCDRSVIGACGFGCDDFEEKGGDVRLALTMVPGAPGVAASRLPPR